MRLWFKSITHGLERWLDGETIGDQLASIEKRAPSGGQCYSAWSASSDHSSSGQNTAPRSEHCRTRHIHKHELSCGQHAGSQQRGMRDIANNYAAKTCKKEFSGHWAASSMQKCERSCRHRSRNCRSRAHPLASFARCLRRRCHVCVMLPLA
jgi:hypothetical protein